MGSHPTATARGEGTVRSWSKGQTVATTPTARCVTNGVTDCKEVVNILYGKERWGATRKGPKNYTAEHVFIDPITPTDADIDRYLARAAARLSRLNGSGTEEREDVEAMARAMQDLTLPNGKPRYPEFLFFQKPDGSLYTTYDDMETFIGHVMGPKGPQSNLTLVQVVRQGTLRFAVRVLKDEIAHELWPHIWIHAQENGLGAMRSQSYGRFDLNMFEPIAGNFKAPKWEMDPTRAPTLEEAQEIAKARQKAIEDGLIAPDTDLVPVNA